MPNDEMLTEKCVGARPRFVGLLPPHPVRSRRAKTFSGLRRSPPREFPQMSKGTTTFQYVIPLPEGLYDTKVSVLLGRIQITRNFVHLEKSLPPKFRIETFLGLFLSRHL